MCNLCVLVKLVSGKLEVILWNRGLRPNGPSKKVGPNISMSHNNGN